MAASVLQVYANEFTPASASSAAATNILNSNLGINLQFDSTEFVTISDNTATTGPQVNGWLYVPTLKSQDACINVTSQYVPKNITTITSVPQGTGFQYAAFGPWTQGCVFSYLNDASSNNAQAFITYLPSRETTRNSAAAAAPNASDPAWDLGDGGAWMKNYHFPVYAISSNDGAALMSLLGNYSGPITTVPYGPTLAAEFGPTASVKLYFNTEISLSTNGVPQLWVFLLIVLGILVGFLLGVSIVMRIVQRRRRHELRRMIAAGTVNLEALGIARIKVTEEILSKMPVYIYVENGGVPGPPHAPPAPEAAETTITTNGENARTTKGSSKRRFLNRERTVTTVSTIPSILEEKTVSFPQDTCPICIDEFENHMTPVRWLPCNHTFHPACVDPLLREYSSLCPICKASVLPKNYVPEVTNNMVRRERLQRRFREMEAQERDREQQPITDQPAHFGGIGRFVTTGIRSNRASTQAQQASSATSNNGTVPVPVPVVQVENVEMQAMDTHQAQQSPLTEATGNPARLTMQRLNTSASLVSTGSASRRPDNVTREEWARQRAETLIGTSETIEQAEQREEARKPLWRRALSPFLPNLR